MSKVDREYLDMTEPTGEHYQGICIEDIATKLGISTESVKHSLRAGRENFRKHWINRGFHKRFNFRGAM